MEDKILLCDCHVQECSIGMLYTCWPANEHDEKSYLLYATFLCVLYSYTCFILILTAVW